MNSEDFYGMVPGSIGTVKYVAKIGVSENNLADMQNKISSQMFSSYLSNYQFLTGNDKLDPQAAFIKARQEARQHAEDSIGTRVFSLHVQIGQDESLEKIRKIEQMDGFVRWEDDTLINAIKSA
jgi:hypothetical protein